MKLTFPFPESTIVQGFGENAVSEYAGMGLKGHPGIDFGVPWGTPIPCAVDSYCYSILSENNPNLMAYRAVCTLVDDGDITWEIIYGHCSDIFATHHTTYKTGDILANVGNTGDVFAGGIEVTEAEKLAGSKAGSHPHFQVRKCKKVPVSQVDSTMHTLNDGYGRLEIDGNCYVVPDYNNGYNGCVDPMQFLSTPPVDSSLPSDRLMVVGNQMMATNPTQARIVLAVARFLKAFNS